MFLHKVLPAAVFSENVNYMLKEEYCNACDTIKRVASMTEKNFKYWNSDKIEKTFDFTCGTSYHHCNDSNNDFVIHGKNKYGTEKSVVISGKNVKEYLIEEIETVYFWNVKEMDYQRKGINNVGWEILSEIGNCGYTDNVELIKRMVEEGGLSKSFLKNWKEGVTVFHPWW